MHLVAANHSIGAGRRIGNGRRLAIARGLVVAVLLLAAGGMLAWLSLGTPLVTGFIPSGRPNPLQVAGGIVLWGFAIVLPATFLLMGIARLAAVIDAVSAMRPRKLTPQLQSALGPDHLAVTDVVLPGGRRLNELVLGPFGIVVLGAVPPPRYSRHVGSRWEIRDDRGRWVPIEDPVQRAGRDAERVKGWLTTDERDFLVRVYAAVVTDDERIERSPACAVVRTGELRAWLEALPPQRGLNDVRREQVAEMIGALDRA